MNLAVLKSVTRRPPVILSSLLIVAILAFLGVNRLVNRFHEQEKALARHLYERGLQEQSGGKPEAALGDFRAALSYSHDNPQYQLSLARALRDTGRTAEAETYLIGLWERTPQEGPVNLALGRLFAREQLFDKAIQYYHNAIYGLWPNGADAKRRDTQFELIDFLIQHKAYPQAQAELITMASSLPGDPALRLRVADLFARAQDYEHALDNTSKSCTPIIAIRPHYLAQDKPRSSWVTIASRKSISRVRCAPIHKMRKPGSYWKPILRCCSPTPSRDTFPMRNGCSACALHSLLLENAWTVAPGAKVSI